MYIYTEKPYRFNEMKVNIMLIVITHMLIECHYQIKIRF